MVTVTPTVERPESRYLRQMEQSLIVPVVMLALLHARQLEDGSPYVRAAEILTDWSDLARDVNNWWSPTELREARAEAEHLLACFAHRVSERLPMATNVIAFPTEGA